LRKGREGKGTYRGTGEGNAISSPRIVRLNAYAMEVGLDCHCIHSQVTKERIVRSSVIRTLRRVYQDRGRRRGGTRKKTNEVIIRLQRVGCGESLDSLGALVDVGREGRVVLMEVEVVKGEVDGSFGEEVLDHPEGRGRRKMVIS
jgi:hypothetical protein